MSNIQQGMSNIQVKQPEFVRFLSLFGWIFVAVPSGHCFRVAQASLRFASAVGYWIFFPTPCQLVRSEKRTPVDISAVPGVPG